MNYSFNEEFKAKYHYNGNLGAKYNKNETIFTLWAPTADSVKVALYGKNGNDTNNNPEEVIQMNKGENGQWSVKINKDLNGEYYNYIVNVNGKENMVVGPYAKAVGVNGKRAMVIDLNETNPEGWNEDKKPKLDYATDAALRKAIKELSFKPTVFIVSQRAASIMHADKIVVLDDGGVSAIGTHEELLDNNQVYNEIYMSQNAVK